jgi:parallel beta-helix repeat protein
MSAYAIAGAFPVVGTRSMKLRRFAMLSSVFVCFSTSGPAFAATLVVDNDFLDCPQAKFSSIQAAVLAAQPGDKILVCPGTYFESVLINKSDLRIEAQAAPDVVVLQGTRAQPFGFHLLNTTGVLLQGFRVQGFGRGNIRIEGSTAPLEGISSGNILRKNVTTDAGTDGIQVVNSSANVVEQNTSFNNLGASSDGIFVCGVPPIVFTDPCTPSGAASSGNIIRHNQTSGNRFGIHLNGTGPDNVVFRNETFDNRMAGISLLRSGQAEPGGTGNVVFRNDSYRNGTRGIQNLGMSPGNVIENNRVFANNQGGIFIGNSTGVTARNNRSENNIGFGIRLQNGAANNLVEKNEVFQNTQDGIQLEGGPLVVTNNFVQLNLIRQNLRDGIRANALTAANTIERNVIRESREHDAHDDSAGPGTGGTANFWINNNCETENRPGLCENH